MQRSILFVRDIIGVNEKHEKHITRFNEYKAVVTAEKCLHLSLSLSWVFFTPPEIVSSHILSL